MNSLEGYLIPYVISQVASVIFLIVAWKKNKMGKGVICAAFFLGIWHQYVYRSN